MRQSRLNAGLGALAGGCGQKGRTTTLTIDAPADHSYALNQKKFRRLCTALSDTNQWRTEHRHDNLKGARSQSRKWLFRSSRTPKLRGASKVRLSMWWLFSWHDLSLAPNVEVRGCALLRSPSRLPGWASHSSTWQPFRPAASEFSFCFHRYHG